MRKVSKKFLTDSPQENGSIVWTVVTPKREKLGYHQDVNVEAEVQFRACHGEPACISFWTGREGSVNKRLKKIDTLINELEKFREAYLEGVEDMKKLIKHKKKGENK